MSIILKNVHYGVIGENLAAEIDLAREKDYDKHKAIFWDMCDMLKQCFPSNAIADLALQFTFDKFLYDKEYWTYERMTGYFIGVLEVAINTEYLHG